MTRKKLGALATYVNGFAFKPDDWNDKGLPIIRIQDLTGTSHQLNYYDGDYPQKIEINDGDVLISWSASLGVYIWNRGKALLNQHIFKVVFDKEVIDKEYFVFAVKYSLDKMRLKMHGATMKHIVRNDFDNIEVPYPPIDKQHKIASILTKIDSIIDKRKLELELLDLLIKSRFVEMFGNPIINPKGWLYNPLSECLENIENGRSFVCDNSCRKGEFPAILKLSAATYGVYNPNENKALTDENLFVKAAEVHNGDLLFTRKNTPDLVGMCAYVNETPPRLMMPDLIFRLNTKENCNKIYLWKLINHELFREKIKGLASGSAQSMSNISKERLMNLEIPLPQIELQNQFANFVQQVDKLKVEVQKSLNETQRLFNSLMQRYFE